MTACRELRKKLERADDVDAVAGLTAPDDAAASSTGSAAPVVGASDKREGDDDAAVDIVPVTEATPPQMTRAVTVATPPAPSDGTTRYYAAVVGVGH